MERQTRDKNLLERFLNDIVFIVEKHARYIVVSGFVAIAHGRIRGTEDIDMIIERLSRSLPACTKPCLKGGLSVSSLQILGNCLISTSPNI